jgi:hypothetical protein
MSWRVPFLLLAASSSIIASPIPIDVVNSFVFAQQLHVDASWDTIVSVIAQATPPSFTTSAALHYDGTFGVALTSTGALDGSYSGSLSGMFLGDLWRDSYSATTTTVVSALADETVTLKAKSTGKWGSNSNIPEEVRGKDFEDSGTIEETKDKANIDITIKTKDAKDKTAEAKALTRTPTKIMGKVKVQDKMEDLTITLDREKKTFVSTLTSSAFKIVVLNNSGSFTVANAPNGGEQGKVSFDLNVSVTPVPEPSTWLVVLSSCALMGLLYRRRRSK